MPGQLHLIPSAVGLRLAAEPCDDNPAGGKPATARR